MTLPRRRVFPLLGVAVLCAVALPARAETGGPIILGRQEQAPGLTLDPFHGSVTATTFFGMNSAKTRGASSSSSDLAFQEALGLSTGGSVVSKNFLDWHAAGSIGLEEEFSHAPHENQTTYGVLHTYDLDATLLRTSELPTNFFARRSQSLTERSFASMLQTTVSEYGAGISYRPIPTTLRVYHTETEQSDLGGKSIYTLNENNLDFSTQYRPAKQHELTLNYNFKQVEQSETGLRNTQDFTYQNLAATHSWALDEANRYNLTQSFSYVQQSGDFAFDHTRMEERLRMRHAQNFETSLEYAYDQQQALNSLDQSHRVQGTFTHRLFDSLTTNGRLGYYMDSRDSGGTVNEWFADVNWGYTKKVPLGRFSASLGLAHDQTENGATGNGVNIVRESHTFADPTPISLTRAGVNPGTIAVFDAAGIRQFVEGVDYTVDRRPDRVEIRRVITGAIDPDAGVLLNYHIDPLPGYTSQTDAFTIGGRYDISEGPLSGVGVYTRYAQQQQSISTTSLALRPDNMSDEVFGIDYRIWKITLNLEQEYRQSDLAPFDATRMSIRYYDRLDERTSLTLTLSESIINYGLEGVRTDFFIANGRLDYQISRELKAIVSTTFRSENDSRRGNTTGFESRGELRWTIRQTQMFLLVRQTLLFTPNTEDESLFLQAGFRREF